MTKRRIGVLMAGDQSYPAYRAFREELRLEGEKSGLAFDTIEFFARGRHELLPSLATDIAAAKPDLVVAIGAVSYYAIRSVIAGVVPIVFAIVIDPIAAGIVPAGDGRSSRITGVTSFEPKQTSDQIRLLKETVGEISTLAVIGDADVPPLLAGLAETAAIAVGIRPVIRLLKSPDEIAPAMAYFRDEGASGLLGLEVPRINTHCMEVAEAATAAGIPTVFGWDMARASPLLAYGTSLSEATRRAAVLAMRILSGESSSPLPVEYTGGMKLTVNLATAGRLGCEVPSSVLNAAVHVDT